MQNYEPLESRHITTGEGRSYLVETSLKLINVVSNVNVSYECYKSITLSALDHHVLVLSSLK